MNKFVAIVILFTLEIAVLSERKKCLAIWLIGMVIFYIADKTMQMNDRKNRIWRANEKNYKSISRTD